MTGSPSRTRQAIFHPMPGRQHSLARGRRIRTIGRALDVLIHGAWFGGATLLARGIAHGWDAIAEPRGLAVVLGAAVLGPVVLAILRSVAGSDDRRDVRLLAPSIVTSLLVAAMALLAGERGPTVGLYAIAGLLAAWGSLAERLIAARSGGGEVASAVVAPSAEPASGAPLREEEFAELLGRPRLPVRPHLAARCVAGRCVLITGAGGSIGSELCRQVARLRPSRLVLLEHSEFALYQIEQELAELARRDPLVAKVPIHAVLGSVASGVLVEELMRSHRVQTVYHAAACKHVGLVESNEVTGVAVNVFGTQTLARAAIKSRVETFVLVSTDKAVRPSSVMGASKRLAELVLQDLASGSWTGVVEHRPSRSRRESPLGCPTRFVIVRFGNVLGSSGSVVPKFLRQIDLGGPVTVTHPDATRYFITLSESVELLIQAGSLGRGGDVLLLDMGAPVRIIDLARHLARRRGKVLRESERGAGDVPVEFCGLMPGEKLHEELLAATKSEPTEHRRIRRASEPGLRGEPLHQVLAAIEAVCDRHDPMELRTLLRELITEEPVAEATAGSASA